MAEGEEGRAPPLPADAVRQPPSPAKGRGAETRVCAGKNRIVQVARTGGRKLFDHARREVFLEWFAATCNVKLSAAQAGIAYQTVFKHRMKDEAFAEAWDRALAQGYARVEARLLQEVMPPLPAPADAGVDPLPPGGEGLEVRVGLDDPAVEAAFDPHLAMLVLREHARRLSGSGDKRKANRTTARAASNKEIAEALAKRLKGFALRVVREKAPLPPHAPREHSQADMHPGMAEPNAPSPSRGEGP
jgi:hypothetical protein